MSTYMLLCNFTEQGVRTIKEMPQRRAAARELGKKFGVDIKAGYLADHPGVIAAFLERIREVDEGDPAMSCQLCKYRTQIVGYEDAVGAPQQGHHHHVRGGEHHHHDHPHPHPHDDG